MHQVPLEFPPFERGQRAQHIARVIQTVHVSHDEPADANAHRPRQLGPISRIFISYRSSAPLGCTRYHLCAELIETLTGRITGVVVADVVIQRVPVIGELRSPIGAGRAAQFPVGCGTGPSGYRRPHVGAGSVTG